MTLQAILNVKGSTVYVIDPDATLADAAKEMVGRNVGSLLVCRRDCRDEDQLLGIITERDLLHAQAEGKLPPSAFKVSEVMTSGLITASPEDGVEQVMGLMTARRIRHLPVVSQGRLVGMVSIGDVVKAHHDRLAMENQFMKDYIHS